MQKVLIIGAGAQGGPCAAILNGEESISEIRLADINSEVLQEVKHRINSPKISPIQLDADNQDELVKAADGMDMVFNFTLIKFNDIIMEAALACKAHYIDTACNTGFLNRWISGEQPKYYNEFRQLGKTALAGCGFSPGIVNVLVRYACDQMDRVESIIMRVGRKSATKSDEVVSAWKPVWSPEILLEDYADPPMVFFDGQFNEVPIFSNPETYSFPEPLGDLLISSHCHEEPYLMPKYYIDKGLQHIDFRYPVDKLAGAFVKMGFADDTPINLNGVDISARDVLMKLVKRPGNKFVQETEESILQSDLTGILAIDVEGEQNGERLTYQILYKFTDGPNSNLQKKLFESYGTTLIYVALPAVVGAKMIMDGEAPNGVISPDVLDPTKFFKGMAERSVPFFFEESISRQKLYRRWSN